MIFQSGWKLNNNKNKKVYFYKKLRKSISGSLCMIYLAIRQPGVPLLAAPSPGRPHGILEHAAVRPTPWGAGGPGGAGVPGRPASPAPSAGLPLEGWVVFLGMVALLSPIMQFPGIRNSVVSLSFPLWNVIHITSCVYVCAFEYHRLFIHLFILFECIWLSPQKLPSGFFPFHLPSPHSDLYLIFTFLNFHGDFWGVKMTISSPVFYRCPMNALCPKKWSTQHLCWQRLGCGFPHRHQHWDVPGVVSLLSCFFVRFWVFFCVHEIQGRQTQILP